MVDVVEVVITVVDADADVVVDFTAVPGDDVVAEPEALGDDAALSLLHAVAAAARAPISSAHRSLDVRDVWDKGECMRQSSNVFESGVPPPAPILPKAHGQLTSGSGRMRIGGRNAVQRNAGMTSLPNSRSISAISSNSPSVDRSLAPAGSPAPNAAWMCSQPVAS